MRAIEHWFSLCVKRPLLRIDRNILDDIYNWQARTAYQSKLCYSALYVSFEAGNVLTDVLDWRLVARPWSELQQVTNNGDVTIQVLREECYLLRDKWAVGSRTHMLFVLTDCSDGPLVALLTSSLQLYIGFLLHVLCYHLDHMWY